MDDVDVPEIRAPRACHVEIAAGSATWPLSVTARVRYPHIDMCARPSAQLRRAPRRLTRRARRRAVRQTTAGRVKQMLSAMSGQEVQQGISVSRDIDRYNEMHDDTKMDAKERGSKYAELVNSYYNLATDFYEWVRT